MECFIGHHFNTDNSMIMDIRESLELNVRPGAQLIPLNQTKSIVFMYYMHTTVFDQPEVTFILQPTYKEKKEEI